VAVVIARPTLGELRTRLRLRVPVPENDSNLTSERLDSILNTALRQVASEHDWPWLQTTETISTVAGTEAYDVEPDWIKTFSLVETGQSQLVQVTNVIDLDVYTGVVRGRPRLFVVYGGQILLRPIPDGVYSLTHRYVQSEPTIAGDSNKALIYDAFSEGVIEYAAFLTLRYIREDKRATDALASYRNWLTRTADNKIQTTQTRTPRVRAGSGV